MYAASAVEGGDSAKTKGCTNCGNTGHKAHYRLVWRCPEKPRLDKNYADYESLLASWESKRREQPVAAAAKSNLTGKKRQMPTAAAAPGTGQPDGKEDTDGIGGGGGDGGEGGNGGGGGRLDSASGDGDRVDVDGGCDGGHRGEVGEGGGEMVGGSDAHDGTGVVNANAAVPPVSPHV